MIEAKHNEAFLNLLFTDTQNEMRWRREVEYKLLGNFILVLSFLISAEGLVYQKIENQENRLIIGAILSLFSLALFYVLRLKIKSENDIYKKLGSNVVKIWQQFKMFEKIGTSGPFLDDASLKYGEGGGYKKTIKVLGVLTLIFCLASMLLAFFFPGSSPQPAINRISAF